MLETLCFYDGNTLFRWQKHFVSIVGTEWKHYFFQIGKSLMIVSSEIYDVMMTFQKQNVICNSLYYNYISDL